MKQLKLSCLLALLLSAVSVNASSFYADGINYNTFFNPDSNFWEAEVIYSKSYEGSIIIPDSVTYSGKTYKVTRISSGAFKNCLGLTTVTVPTSVNKIESAAFYNSGITDISLPNTIVSIGSSAFYDCDNLTEIAIPNSVTSIQANTFYSCDRLVSVTIPESIVSIENKAFYLCSIGLEINVTVSDMASFCNNKIMKLIEKEVDKPVHLIRDEGSEITELIIPESVDSIGYEAFYNCRWITTLTVHDNVKNIDYTAFKQCYSLETVFIPVPDLSFFCNNEVVGEIQNSLKMPVHLLDKTGTEITELIIPEGVTKIGTYAFCGCSALTSVTLPNSLTDIGYAAFSGCSGLSSVTLPNSLTSIGSNAFQDCSGITSFALPNGITEIPSKLLSGCIRLRTIVLGDNITRIGYDAFPNNSLTLKVGKGTKVLLYLWNYDYDAKYNSSLKIQYMA